MGERNCVWEECRSREGTRWCLSNTAGGEMGMAEEGGGIRRAMQHQINTRREYNTTPSKRSDTSPKICVHSLPCLSLYFIFRSLPFFFPSTFSVFIYLCLSHISLLQHSSLFLFFNIFLFPFYFLPVLSRTSKRFILDFLLILSTLYLATVSSCN